MNVCSGKSYPLGATLDSGGTNFALFSANAEKVELCLFNTSGSREIARIPLPCRSNDVWHGYVHGVTEGTRYGYRVYGPYQPEQGHRFNHHKLLIDPYTRRLHGNYVDSDENFGYTPGHPDSDLSFDTRDNSHNIPKCVVTSDDFNWQNDKFPDHSLADTVIYEAHVKGLTEQFPRLRQQRRGTYAAIANNRVISHLKELGITALELLPVHTSIDDSFLLDKQLSNYWGYNTLCFFAPTANYAEVDPIQEFRRMVKALHAADIEVILDVVYNHTAEGNELGPTLSFRGIDNASYYRLDDNPRYYVNHSGCGNTLKAAHPRVVQLIMDSLRFWTDSMHVDGFRFDLASTLARRALGYDKNSGFFEAIMQDPALARSKLIAEPWDCGNDGYQLGNFPPRFSEWNDQYRDTVRKFWSGEAAQLQQLSKAIHGSSEVFEWQRRGPDASINLITAHDGFTLLDLVSYSDKNNEANGEENRDGHSSNYSNNNGFEGQTDDAAINTKRAKQRRNLLSTLLLSQGVPMLLAGDELGNTQNGNNNAYCQDNSISWLDWSQVESCREHLEFVKNLIQLRKKYPALRRTHYLHGNDKSRSVGLPDISWLNKHSSPMSDDEWHNGENRFIAILLCGDAGTDSISEINAACTAHDSDSKSKTTAIDHGASATSSMEKDSSLHVPTARCTASIKAEGIVLIIINGFDHVQDFELPDLKRTWHLEMTTEDPLLTRTRLAKVFQCPPMSVSLCALD